MTVRANKAHFSLDQAGKHRNEYLARIDPSHKTDDVLNPSYFGQIMASDILTPHDIITIEWTDCSKYGRLYVVGQDTRHQLLMTRTLEFHDFDDEDGIDLPKGWDVTWKGGTELFVITHNDKIRESGFASKLAAETRIAALSAEEHIRTATSKAATRRATKKAA